MFNPRQAQNDFYIQKIATLICLILIACFFLIIAFPDTYKYFYLKNFGTETKATVIEVQNGEYGNNNNIDPGFSQYVFEFSTDNNTRIQSELILPDLRFGIGGYKALFESSDKVDIIYDTSNSKILLPKELHLALWGGVKISMISILSIVLFTILAMYQLKLFRNFRNQSKYY